MTLKPNFGWVSSISSTRLLRKRHEFYNPWYKHHHCVKIVNICCCHGDTIMVSWVRGTIVNNSFDRGDFIIVTHDAAKLLMVGTNTVPGWYQIKCNPLMKMKILRLQKISWNARHHLPLAIRYNQTCLPMMENMFKTNINNFWLLLLSSY